MSSTIVSCEQHHDFVIGQHDQGIIKINHAQQRDVAYIKQEYSDDLEVIFHMFASACPHLEACHQLHESNPDDMRCLAMIGFRG